MAAVSPITINTSPLESSRTPTVTPPSLHRTSRKLISSSPQLPSPSTFVKPHAPALKSGSRAQQAPEGVSIGFASAARLWKDKKLEVEKFDHGEVETRVTKRVKKHVVKQAEKLGSERSGKLKKPKRKVKHPEPDKAGTKALLPEEFEYYGSPLARSNRIGTPTQPDVYDVVAEPIDGLTTAVSPSLSLMRYAFEEPQALPETTTTVQQPKSVKKTRKAPAKKADGDGPVVTKKPRKKKAKSDSIILNSDEPDPGDGSIAMHLRTDKRATEGVSLRAEAKKSKKRAAKISEGEKENVAPRRPSASPTNSPRMSQTNGAAGGQVRETPDQSTYFAKPEVPTVEPAESTLTETLAKSPDAAQKPYAVSHSLLEVQSVAMASRRRLDWTPVKDTAKTDTYDSRPQTANSELSNASNVPRIQLTEILNNFAYASEAREPAVISERTPTGEAVTKRRRIELSESIPTIAVSIQKDVKDKPKKVKGVKPPKKKPHTVTAQATSAYLPPKEIQTKHGTVSAFFSPPKENATATGESGAGSVLEVQTVVAKLKKTRKPRAKLGAAAGATAEANVKTKKKRSKKKAGADADETRQLLRLYPPSQATAQMKRQDFLFGTSSQLAPAESPEFIRQMQVAMQESEEIQARDEEDDQLHDNSRAAGTALYLAKPDKMLWDISARDSEGGLLQREDLNLIDASGLEMIESDKVCQDDDDPQPSTAARRTAVDTAAEDDVVLREHAEATMTTEKVELPVKASLKTPAPALPQVRPDDDVDDWIILKSDDSSSVRQPVESDPQWQSPLPVQALSPRIFRPALNPLDSNTSLAFLGSPDKATSYSQIRTSSTSSRDQSGLVKRPRGRPRKDAGVTTGPLIVPKRVGRPPKQAVAASSPTRKTSKKTVAVASQPESQTPWLDVDEISDCEAPNTPSPPRRRASSSPPALRPLQLSPSNSQDIKQAEPTLSKGQVVKPDGPQWPSMRAILFPQITKTIKSAPCSNDPASLSWWQKILMYDPLVVEDLTAWLDDQGLRVEVRKVKSTKGKKRKMEEKRDGSASEADYEICKEPLQPWMVQRWCENKSICCYMKDGSWRAKRGA